MQTNVKLLKKEIVAEGQHQERRVQDAHEEWAEISKMKKKKQDWSKKTGHSNSFLNIEQRDEILVQSLRLAPTA